MKIPLECFRRQSKWKIPSAEIQGISAILVATICFGSMGVLVRMLRGEVHPVSLAFVRFLAQSLLLMPFFYGYVLRRGPIRQSIYLHGIRGGLGVGTMVAYYTALQSVPVGMTNLLAMSALFWSTLFAWLLLKERVARRQFMWGGLMVVGTAITLLGGKQIRWDWDLIGVAFALLCGLTMGMSRTLVKYMRTRMCSPVEVVFFFGVFGAALTTPGFFLQSNWDLGAEVWLALTGMGALGTFAQLLLTFGFRHTPVFVAGVCQLNGTLTTVLLGYLLLEEVPTAGFYAGAVVMSVGMVGILWKASKTQTVGDQSLDTPNSK